MDLLAAVMIALFAALPASPAASHSGQAGDLPAAGSPAPSPVSVSLARVPRGGIQPQLAQGEGGPQLVWFEGDPAAGELFHARYTADGFAAPIPVGPGGTAIAIGNVRGAHLALGREGRPHVAWMGSAKAQPRAADGETPMLTTGLATRLAGEAFEPPLNAIASRVGLDGGGTLAADEHGRVFVLWHAPEAGAKDEAGRAVWVARSGDGGESFEPERRAWSEPTGACGCCGMRALCSGELLYVLYRSARETVHRDMVALVSSDQGLSFRGAVLDPWTVGQCVMSTAALASARVSGEPTPRVVAAWETEGQIYWARLDGDARRMGPRVVAPGPAGGRKHPALAIDAQGHVLLAWTEGLGWKRGGELAWQVFAADGNPLPGASGRRNGVPPWSLVAAGTLPDGSFLIVY